MYIKADKASLIESIESEMFRCFCLQFFCPNSSYSSLDFEFLTIIQVSTVFMAFWMKIVLVSDFECCPKR